MSTTSHFDGQPITTPTVNIGGSRWGQWGTVVPPFQKKIKFNLLKTSVLTSTTSVGSPVATASVERVFSAMTIVKNKLRNSLGDQILNDCLIIFIERDLFSQVSNDDVINRFQEYENALCQL